MRATDGTSTDTQNLVVSVTNENEAPAITSDGGGDAAAVVVAENSSAVTAVAAADPDAASALAFSINGGADAGHFVIDSSTGAANAAHADTIVDFTQGLDKLQFNAATYGLAVGPLAADNLQTGTSAASGHAQFLFNTGTKTLYWDADGLAGGEIKIVTLSGVTSLLVSDFLVT